MQSLDLDLYRRTAALSPSEVHAKGVSGRRREIRRSTKAMASVVTAQVLGPIGDSAAGPRIEVAIGRAFDEFRAVERHCSRFDETSALMRANRDPWRWHRVPEPLYSVVVEAMAAHRRTGGLFDPRIYDRLVELGYDRSFHLLLAEQTGSGVCPPAPDPVAHGPGRGWQPRAVPVLRLINLGGARIDLGGIGKGMAIRKGAARIRPAAGDFLLDAGGDIYAAGAPMDAQGWRVGVESPSGSELPVAVLEISDKAVATSSIRVRSWKRGEQPVHHLIDPRTGEPGGDGLAAVTVVDADPVMAETAAKSLFISGRESIADRASALDLAALWVSADGVTGMSTAIEPFVIWTDA